MAGEGTIARVVIGAAERGVVRDAAETTAGAVIRGGVEQGAATPGRRAVDAATEDLLGAARRAPSAPSVPPAPTGPGGAIAAPGAATTTPAAASAATQQQLRQVEATIATVARDAGRAGELPALRKQADTLRSQYVNQLHSRIRALESAATTNPAQRAELAALQQEHNTANLQLLRQRSVDVPPTTSNTLPSQADAARTAHNNFAREAVRQGDMARQAGNAPLADALKREAAQAYERAAVTARGTTERGTVWVSDNASAQRLYTELGDAAGVYRAAARTGQTNTVVEGTFRLGGGSDGTTRQIARDVIDLARRDRGMAPVTDTQFRAIQRQFDTLSPTSHLNIFAN